MQSIILLHGALGSKKQFESLKSRLSNRFKVYDFNFSGHGGVATDEDFSMDLFVANTIAFIENSGIGKTNVFGYSMGGYVALNLAKRHPNLVSKITTLGTKFNWTIEAAEKEVRMLNPDKIEEKVPRFAESLNTIHQPNDWKEVVRQTAKMMTGLAAGKKLKEADFQTIDHDVLIGIGTLDKMVSIEESEHIANVLPNGALKIIEGFQHPIEKVDVEELAVFIEGFLIKP